MIEKKKRRPAGVTFNITIDADTGELDDYLWDENHEPPLVKPEKGKPDKDRSKN
jgi:hypothetical protein